MQLINGWIDTAQEDNLMANSESRQGMIPSEFVVHGTAGGSFGNGVIDYMRTAGVSTHFVISTDGTIWQAVSTEVAAWANAPLMSPTLNFKNAAHNPNLWTISVEFCKPDKTNTIAITDAQFASGVALARVICDTYGIPKQRSNGNGGIIGHCDLNSAQRAGCPGTFPWDNFIAAIQGDDPVQVQQLQQQLATLQQAYNVVVPEKNALIAEKAQLQQQLTTLQQAYNVVVPEKNALIGEKTQLQQQIAQLQQQLTTAQATGNTATLQQQIAALTAKLQQINTLSKI
jgi:N-acetyl-anhydromuramyl-L-alanine amidase AmpD